MHKDQAEYTYAGNTELECNVVVGFAAAAETDNQHAATKIQVKNNSVKDSSIRHLRASRV